jgi:hypothetical protein
VKVNAGHGQAQQERGKHKPSAKTWNLQGHVGSV